jgi:hypothetical protein
MAKVNAPVYVGQTLYTPDGPDVAEEHLPLIGDHLFDGGKPEAEDEPEKIGDKVERLRRELAEAEAEFDLAVQEMTAAKAAEDTAAATAKAEAEKSVPAAQAGVEKWLAYAESIGIQVPAESREDKAAIRTLVEEHEKSQG